MKAQWISHITDSNFDVNEKWVRVGMPASYFRKKFSLSKEIKSAKLTISSLGINKAFINGKEAFPDYFAPGWTNYSKRILYREYDVTNLIEKDNAISVAVGDGWYVGLICNQGRNNYGTYPLALYAIIDLIYIDGTTEQIVTDDSWLAGQGAIRENDFLYGEVYDFRLPHTQTSLVDFDDTSWVKADIHEDVSDKLCYCDYEPVLLQETLWASMVLREEKKYIYDFSQNFAGVVRIVAKGDSGSIIRIRYGEMLNEDSSLHTDNLRIARAMDEIIMNGEMVEYIPTFTYHGFRYIEITVEGNAEIFEIEARALHNKLTRTGEVKTDNDLFNKIYTNSLWGQRSNLVDVPTDCPQRNERLGWSGDTQVFSRTAMYNENAKKFYEKHMICVDDDRRGGEISDIAPFPIVAGYDRTGWRDVGIVVPYNLWMMYGDKEKVSTSFNLIDDYIDRQISTADEQGCWWASHYGDWLDVRGPEDKKTLEGISHIPHREKDGALATLSNILLFQYAIKMFEDIGHDTCKVKDILAKSIAGFKANLMDNEGNILFGTQTTYCMAYRAGVITKESARRNLIKLFADVDDHIVSGFVGIRFVLPVLCDVGLSDLAYKCITNTSFPSWGYSVANGATTIWERWNSYTIEFGFANKIMNSFNHYSFGSCAEWMYEYVLGIKPIVAGWKKISVCPYVDRTGKVNMAEGHYDSASGTIKVSWKKCDGVYTYRIEKPKDMDAEFIFDNVISITCDGKKSKKFKTKASVIEVKFN